MSAKTLLVLKLTRMAAAHSALSRLSKIEGIETVFVNYADETDPESARTYGVYIQPNSAEQVLKAVNKDQDVRLSYIRPLPQEDGATA